MSELKAGSASRIINCEIGDLLAGQLRPRVSKSIRDNLEANAFFVTDGRHPSLIINCDLLFLDVPFVQDVAAEIERKTGVPAAAVMISCTHTHSGPYTAEGIVAEAEKNESYLRKLKTWLVEVAEKAVSHAVPARIGWARGETQIGYNRRLCWADRSHSMYGNPFRDDFSGHEGPDDPSHAILFARDEKDAIIGIVHNNTCHCTCVGQSDYVSADYPGAARAHIRDALECDVPILYLQGAAGDICCYDLLRHKVRGSCEQRLKEIGLLLAGETLRLLKSAEVHDSAVLDHRLTELKVGIRIPSDADLAHAREVLAAGPQGDRTTDVDSSFGFQQGLIKLYEDYHDDPFETLFLHTVRIGDFALASAPCEFYCQFGLDIKRRSPARVTAVSELTHGSRGYCPTVYGIMGRGYSAATYYGSRLEPFAGYKIVEEHARQLYSMFMG